VLGRTRPGETVNQIGELMAQVGHLPQDHIPRGLQLRAGRHGADQHLAHDGVAECGCEEGVEGIDNSALHDLLSDRQRVRADRLPAPLVGCTTIDDHTVTAVPAGFGLEAPTAAAAS
jgi:hypothetical protein